MDKIYSQIDLPNDILSKIRCSNTESAISTLISILECDEFILLPRRIEMFRELVQDKARAESLAVATCKGYSFQVRDIVQQKPRLPIVKTVKSDFKINFKELTVKYRKISSMELEKIQSEFNGKAVACEDEQNGGLIYKIEVQLPGDPPQPEYHISLIDEVTVYIGDKPYETTYIKREKEIKYHHMGTLPEIDAIELAKSKFKSRQKFLQSNIYL